MNCAIETKSKVIALVKMREMDKILWPILVRSTVQPAIDLIVVCK